MPSEANPKTLLVVEDDLFLVKAYQYIFQKEGFKVTVAFDGPQAIGLLAGSPPDVVLLDLMLPQVDGFGFLEAAGKHPSWSHVPVVIVTNLARGEDVSKGKAMGAVEYFVKANTDIHQVLDRVKQCVLE